MYKRENQIIFILIILISVTIISIKFCLKDSQPFGVTILRVSSNSMVPKFKKGDFIVIRKQEKYNVGDIITFEVIEENSKYYITHRIVEKNENEFITKGDANNKNDNYKVYENAIKGKVIFTW